MTQFDYARAWREMALPAYHQLPELLRELYERTALATEGARQNAALGMDWPSPELRADFDSWPPVDLARAARCVYFCGHWAPGGQLFEGAEHGGHWKFSHLADQALRARLGLPELARRDGKEPRGLSWQVHQGELRACHDYRSREWGEGWTWHELGLATPELMERARAHFTGIGGRDPRPFEEKRDSWERDPADSWSTKPYKPETPEEKRERESAETLAQLPALPEGASFRPVKVDTVHQPHPFVIGPRHFPKDGGMYIRPEQAPCAMQGCELDHDEHEVFCTLFVEVPAGLTADELSELEGLHAWLLAVKEADLGLDGFAFPPAKEGTHA